MTTRAATGTTTGTATGTTTRTTTCRMTAGSGATDVSGGTAARRRGTAVGEYATEPGLYVYGVSRGLPHEALERVGGVGGAPVRVIEEHGLAAVVSPVSLDEFGEDPLKRHLE